MTIKISINDKQVTNPLLRFVIGIIVASLALLIISVTLLLLLPVFWLAILWLIILLISLSLIMTTIMQRRGKMPSQKRLKHKYPEN